MAFHLTEEGLIAEIMAENREQQNVGTRVIASREEWDTIAGQWPLKRLVSIWNALPGVTPVEKFAADIFP